MPQWRAEPHDTQCGQQRQWAVQRGTVGTGLQTASPEEFARYAMHPSMMVLRRVIDTAYALPLPLPLTTVLVEQSGGSTTENANKQTRARTHTRCA